MEYDYQQFLVAFGSRVRDLRLQRHLSHKRMIVDHGFHLNQVARIEKGEGVSVQTMLKLCAAFDLTLQELLGGIPDGLVKDGAADSGITERKMKGKRDEEKMPHRARGSVLDDPGVSAGKPSSSPASSTSERIRPA